MQSSIVWRKEKKKERKHILVTNIDLVLRRWSFSAVMISSEFFYSRQEQSHTLSPLAPPFLPLLMLLEV